MLHNLLDGLSGVFAPGTFPYLITGMCIGMFVAMLPGLGVGIALSLMLPFLYHMQTTAAIVLMLGTLAGEYFAASITAILLNTPGAPESYPTTHDGFPMAQRGEAGRALGISATCTWLGGWIGCVVFVGLLQLVGSFISVFKPPEYAAIIVFALVVVGQSGSSQASKVIVSGGFGFMLSFVGSDPVSGSDRFTGGLPALLSGLDVVPFALGVFAVTQMVVMYGTGRSVASQSGRVGLQDFRSQIRSGVKDTLSHPVDLIRSAVLASGLGLIPGIGGFSANYISYGIGQRTSRERKRFGTGVPAGLISAEGSSLAKEAGSLLPAVALGLPSGVGMVLFIAALSILGIQPGIPLLTEHPSLPYSMMWALAIAGFLSCCIGLFLAPQLSKVTFIRGPVLLPFICGLAALGSFSAVTSTAGMLEMLFFAVVGLIARKCNYSVAAMAVGLVLGSTFDDNAYLTAQSYGWSFLWRSPLALAFLVVAAVIVAKKMVDGHRQRRSGRREPAAAVPQAGGSAEEPWALQMIVDGVFAVGSAWYCLVALGYPSAAGTIPAVTAAVVGGVSTIRLVGDVWRWARRRPGWREWIARLSVGRDMSGELVGAPAVVGGPVSSRSALPPRISLRPAARLPRLSATLEPAREPAPGQAGPSAVQQVPAASNPAGDGPGDGVTPFGIRVRELAAIAWAASFIGSVLLFGFQVGIPLTAFFYCLLGIRIPSRQVNAVYAVLVVGVLYAIATVFLTEFHLTFSGIFS
jgi:putative tricarboxylic transport membrane protein